MNINDHRKAIDDLDQRIVELISERGRHAHEIGRTKAAQAAEAFAPAREREVFDRLAALNPGPLPDAALRAIYREIISACRASSARWPSATGARPAATPTWRPSTVLATASG